MKNAEELSLIRDEISALSAKLAELSEDELKQVVGGIGNHEMEFGAPALIAKILLMRQDMGYDEQIVAMNKYELPPQY